MSALRSIVAGLVLLAQVWTPLLAQTLALRSGADTSLIGATGRADRIIASVGRDLRLETLQDASTYDSRQQSIGVKANHLTVVQHEARIGEWVQCKDTARWDEVRDRYADLSKKQRAELVDCEGAECTKNARKLTALAASYDARASELLEKSRQEGGLSEADREELKAVKGGHEPAHPERP